MNVSWQVLMADCVMDFVIMYLDLSDVLALLVLDSVKTAENVWVRVQNFKFSSNMLLKIF